MFIDTHTRETMLRSFCSVLRISQYELRDVIWEIYRSTGNDYDDCISKIEAFIYEHISDESLPDEILLFHFARRLKGTEEDTIGRNLADLLTTPNALSDFLKDHQLTFEMGEQHIETYYKGNVVDWDKCWEGNNAYMKVRFGYYKGREDFCFNGFAFKDRLYKNDYARQLYGVPEFLSGLVECLGCQKVEEDFMENSDYYCYEYKLPFEKVMFDDHDSYSLHQKQIYLLRCVFERLMDYQCSDPRYLFDHDNPILRLGDYDTIPEEMFVTKELVTLDMLR